MADHSDDTTVPHLSDAGIAKCYANWEASMGESPAPDEEPSYEQLGALHHFVSRGSVP